MTFTLPVGYTFSPFTQHSPLTEYPVEPVPVGSCAPLLLLFAMNSALSTESISPLNQPLPSLVIGFPGHAPACCVAVVPEPE